MNGVLALPTMSVPPGATVKLSGWDLSSTIRISAADAACIRPANNATQAASRRERKLGIVKSPYVLDFSMQGRSRSDNSCQTSSFEDMYTALSLAYLRFRLPHPP